MMLAIGHGPSPAVGGGQDLRRVMSAALGAMERGCSTWRSATALPAVTSVPGLRRRLLEGVRTLSERGAATVRSAARGSASQRLVRAARTAHSQRSRRSKWIFCRTQGEFFLRFAAKKITLAQPCYTGEGCRNGTWLKAAESAATRPAASKTKKAAANKALPEEERSQRKNWPGHPARQERRDERSSRRFLLRHRRRRDAPPRRSEACAASPRPIPPARGGTSASN